MKDEVPNVQFCVCKIIAKTRNLIDPNVFTNELANTLKTLANDSDKDVANFA